MSNLTLVIDDGRWCSVAGERAFVDTNVFVYALDAGERAKRDRAIALLSEEAGPEYVCSSQALGEFFHVIRRKFGIGWEGAKGLVERLQRPCEPGRGRC